MSTRGLVVLQIEPARHGNVRIGRQQNSTLFDGVEICMVIPSAALEQQSQDHGGADSQFQSSGAGKLVIAGSRGLPCSLRDLAEILCRLRGVSSLDAGVPRLGIALRGFATWLARVSQLARKIRTGLWIRREVKRASVKERRF